MVVVAWWDHHPAGAVCWFVIVRSLIAGTRRSRANRDSDGDGSSILNADIAHPNVYSDQNADSRRDFYARHDRHCHYTLTVHTDTCG